MMDYEGMVCIKCQKECTANVLGLCKACRTKPCKKCGTPYRRTVKCDYNYCRVCISKNKRTKRTKEYVPNNNIVSEISGWADDPMFSYDDEV